MKGFLILIFSSLLHPGYGQEYHFSQVPSIPDADVQQISLLFQSADQMVWLGTEKGIFSFDGRKYQSVPRPDGHLQKVTAIAEGKPGQVWIGYEDGYIQRLISPGENKIIPTDSIHGATISKILFHPNGSIFITTYGKGVWLLEKGLLRRITFQTLAEIDDIYDAVIDHQGKVWLATDNGIWIYQTNPSESLLHLDRHRGLPDEIVTQLEMEQNGDVWIGLYDHGLARYVAGRDTILALMPLQTSSGNVIGLVKGREDQVWFGTEKKVDVYSSDGTGHSIRMPLDMNDRLKTLLFDLNGNLWLASGNRLFIANTQIEYVMPGIDSIQTIAFNRGRLWLGCEQGLFNMLPGDSMAVAFPFKEKINVLSIYADPSGFLWIGTFGQGLYIINPNGKQVRHLTEKDKLSNNSILNIDGLGHKVWLATLGGITQMDWKSDPTTDPLTVVEFQDKFNFPAGYVYDVYVSEKGDVWFGTDGKGMFYLKDEMLHSFIIQNQPMLEQDEDIKTIYSITTDDHHHIWISGSKGQILELDSSGHTLNQAGSVQGSLNSLITSGEGEIVMIQEGLLQVRNKDGETFMFNEASGLKSFSPNINSATRDNHGTIWIADADRILHYIPFSRPTSHFVEMHLEAISPASLLTKELVKLEPDSNFLDIRFTGLWYQDPLSVRYRYMLEGHDQDWIYSTEGRAVYSRLTPGKYTFLVEGSQSDDFSRAKPLRRELIVMPPLYLRWWFISTVLMIVLWLIITYIMARIKRIKNLHQLEKEKTMLQLHAIQAQVNPHFLFNSFNTLSSIIEEDQLAAVDYVDQLSGFFRGVLMHRNAELILIEEELEIVRNYTYILQKRYGENLRIREDIKHFSGWIAPLSIQLLVENAIKHNTISREKPLTIFLSIDDQWVTVSNMIQPKIQPSSESTGFGLSSLVARYQYLTREKIEIRKEQNTFTVKIPVMHSDKPL